MWVEKFLQAMFHEKRETILNNNGKDFKWYNFNILKHLRQHQRQGQELTIQYLYLTMDL